MTVHLVNLTNPMMMKGPFRELIPVDAEVTISIPASKKPAGVHLLISGKKPVYDIRSARPDDPRLNDSVGQAVGRGKLHIKTPQVLDHEIIAVDFV